MIYFWINFNVYKRSDYIFTINMKQKTTNPDFRLRANNEENKFKTCEKINKNPLTWENNRKRQSMTRKYLLPLAEMNFLLISLTFFFTTSLLPLAFANPSQRYGNTHQLDDSATGKSIPRKP